MKTNKSLTIIPSYPEIDHTTSKSYGANHVIRQFIDWPDDIPLPIVIPYNFKRRFILSNVWIEKQMHIDILTKRELIGKKHMHKCGHAILYLPEIEEQERQGTLSMPRHPSYANQKFNSSSQLFYDNFDKYCQKFIRLPDKFHPLTICLFHTMAKKCIPICEKYKLNYVTNGFNNSLFFERLRKLMMKYEYVTSYTGTPMYFAFHWGCKFFYHDPPLIWMGVSPHFTPSEYYDIFTPDNADESLSLQKHLHPQHFNFLGKEFKRSKEKIISLIEECRKDIRYQFCMSIYEKNGKNINAIYKHLPKKKYKK